MGRVIFDIVQENLHVRSYPNTSLIEICYSLDSSDNVLKSGRAVDEVIGEDIGKLKVRKSHLGVLEQNKKVKESDDFITLESYLDAYEKRSYFEGFSNTDARLFNIPGFLIKAINIENPKNLLRRESFKQILDNPDNFTDMIKIPEFLSVKVDKNKTLAYVKRLYNGLNKEIPDQYVQFLVVKTKFHHGADKTLDRYIGCISLQELRIETTEKVDGITSKLIDKLKEFQGPCLSYDTANLLGQMLRINDNAYGLLGKFGDILLNQNWQQRFFRFDP